MAEQEVTLMKGNEAIAHAAIRCGADGYFGYPITPQSEVIETLCALKPWETTGMVVVQAESEVASINMVYGAAGAGKRALTSSSWTTIQNYSTNKTVTITPSTAYPLRFCVKVKDSAGTVAKKYFTTTTT